MAGALGVIVVAAVVLSSGCRLSTLLPRTHTVAASPDGRHTAYVRQHFGIDPPNDHLYLTDETGSGGHLMALAPDMDWCRTVVWTPDGHHVAFVIRDQYLAVFDASSRELTAMLPLVGRDGYPGSLEVRNVTFEGEAGTIVAFDRYERATTLVNAADGVGLIRVPIIYPTGATDETPARFLSRERVAIPANRLRIRLTTVTGGTVGPAFARVHVDDDRIVDVPIRPGADGVAELAAIDEGPFPIVEIGLPGRPRTVVFRDVLVTPAPLDVVLRPVIPLG